MYTTQPTHAHNTQAQKLDAVSANVLEHLVTNIIDRFNTFQAIALSLNLLLISYVIKENLLIA